MSPLGSPAMLLSHDPIEVGCDDDPELVGVVSCPRLEVLSYLARVSYHAGEGRMETYSDDFEVLHEARLRTCK